MSETRLVLCESHEDLIAEFDSSLNLNEWVYEMNTENWATQWSSHWAFTILFVFYSTLLVFPADILVMGCGGDIKAKAPKRYDEDQSQKSYDYFVSTSIINIWMAQKNIPFI